MAFAKLLRRRGGQPGNTNRLVHGRYSRRLPRELTTGGDPRVSDDPNFELAMARVHLVQLLTAQKKARRRQWLSYERAVIDCLGLILSLISAGVRRRRYQPDIDRILDEFRMASGNPTLQSGGDSNLNRTSAPHDFYTRDLGVRPGFEPPDSRTHDPWPE